MDDAGELLVRSVWKENRQNENNIIRTHLPHFPFISIATKHSRYRDKIPAKSCTAVHDSNHGRLQLVLDAFPVYQVGIVLSDGSGNLPTCQETGQPCIWEFNLRSNATDDRGINPPDFIIGLFATGAMRRSRFCWVVFKGGLDFGSLVRLITGVELPQDRRDLSAKVEKYFPRFYDLMHVVAATPGLSKARGKLDRVAKAMGVVREGGAPHGAASDGLTTMRVFMKAKREKFGGSLPEDQTNVIFGFCKEGERS
ncbi:unnamed protein product [Victoria cruziana]